MEEMAKQLIVWLLSPITVGPETIEMLTRMVLLACVAAVFAWAITALRNARREKKG